MAALTPEELRAVVAREVHHAGVRDRSEILLVRVAADGLLFAPGTRRSEPRRHLPTGVAVFGLLRRPWP
jgi:hypothetical protein